MKAKEFIIVEAKKNIGAETRVKTRNPVAKNLSVTASGAGAHRDKKRDAKMGVEKHKKSIPAMAEGQEEKNILTRIRQIQYDRKLSGTDSNAGELHRLKEKLKELRNKQGVAEDVSENQDVDTFVVYDTKGKVLDRLDVNTAAQKYGLSAQDIKNQLRTQDNTTLRGAKGQFTVGKPMVNKTESTNTQGVAEGTVNPLQDIDQNAWHLIQGDKPIAINFPDEARARSFHSGHGYGKETKVLHGSQVRRNTYIKHNPDVINWPEYSKGVAKAEKKPHPKTWHDVDKKLGKAVDKMSQAEKVKKGLAHPDTLKKKKQEG